MRDVAHCGSLPEEALIQAFYLANMLTPLRQHALPQFRQQIRPLAKEYSHTITEFAIIGSRTRTDTVSRHLMTSLAWVSFC